MGDAFAIDMDLAAGDVFEAGDDPQQRRLSAAGSFTARSMPCSTSMVPKDLRALVSFSSAIG
jgi:hypothetical protein